MSLQEQYDSKRTELENDIAEGNRLVEDLKRQMATTTDPQHKGKLEVNIEDVTRQLNDWHYELSALTTGKE